LISVYFFSKLADFLFYFSQGSLNLSEIDALVASKMVPAVVEMKPAPAPPPTAPPPAEPVSTSTPVAAAPVPSNNHVASTTSSTTTAVRGPSPPTPSTAAPPTTAPVMSQRLHAFRASSLGTPASMNQPQAPASQPVAPVMPAAVATAAPLPNSNAWSIAPATVAHSFAHSSTAMATNAALSHGSSSHPTSAHAHSAHGMSTHGPPSSVGSNGAPIATRRLSVAYEFYCLSSDSSSIVLVYSFIFFIAEIELVCLQCRRGLHLARSAAHRFRWHPAIAAQPLPPRAPLRSGLLRFDQAFSGFTSYLTI
jgi:hypothetical protein